MPIFIPSGPGLLYQAVSSLSIFSPLPLPCGPYLRFPSLGAKAPPTPLLVQPFFINQSEVIGEQSVHNIVQSTGEVHEEYMRIHRAPDHPPPPALSFLCGARLVVLNLSSRLLLQNISLSPLVLTMLPGIVICIHSCALTSPYLSASVCDLVFVVSCSFCSVYLVF